MSILGIMSLINLFLRPQWLCNTKLSVYVWNGGIAMSNDQMVSTILSYCEYNLGEFAIINFTNKRHLFLAWLKIKSMCSPIQIHIKIGRRIMLIIISTIYGQNCIPFRCVCGHELMEPYVYDTTTQCYTIFRGWHQTLSTLYVD